mgnify:CR=1 FL=1
MIAYFILILLCLIIYFFSLKFRDRLGLNILMEKNRIQLINLLFSYLI